MASVTGPEIERLIQLLARLPGLGPRSARRAALHLIKKREQLLSPLADADAGGGANGSSCARPAAMSTRSDPCTICRDQRRDETHPRGGRGRVGPVGAGACAGDQRPLPRARRHVVGARRRRPEGSQPRPPAQPRRGGRRSPRSSWRSTPPSTGRRPPITSPTCSRPSASSCRGSPTACRSAASSIISTKARWRRRCGSARRAEALVLKRRLGRAPGLRRAGFMLGAQRGEFAAGGHLLVADQHEDAWSRSRGPRNATEPASSQASPGACPTHALRREDVGADLLGQALDARGDVHAVADDRIVEAVLRSDIADAGDTRC